MKFNIKEIAVEGQTFDRLLDENAVCRMLKSAGVEDVQGPAQVQLALEISQSDPTVLVRGSVRGEFFVPCSRCLGPARVTVDEAGLNLTFFPASQPEERDQELELSLEDLDTYTHDGKEVDLEPVVREMMVLAIPLAPLCQEACQGICTQCGADLNRETCGCAQPEKVVSPWVAALQKAKKKL